ncbi:hypothetical protein ACJMK2_021532 [Sinanodonta woodiana]|uniref:Uncharacterized protein n=1 Tax=Sinanodonta woodiana TaxID=1069815 RepID=A0ABD3TGD1_SINWO
MIISRILLLLVPVATQVFKEDVTAGNSKCRFDNKCGFHQDTTYSWCFVDYSGYWGSCCTDSCRITGRDFLWCPTGGTTYQHCGGHSTKDVLGRQCLENHPCGTHFEEGGNGVHWCFVDLNQNWGYCCAPRDKCDYNGERYKWCHVSGDVTSTRWQYCKNDE